MSKEERRQYKQWEERFKTAQTRVEKMRKEGTGVPSDKVFTIAEAVKLLKGEYHEEVEAADQNDGDITGKPTKANKAVFIGHRDNLNDELNV